LIIGVTGLNFYCRKIILEISECSGRPGGGRQEAISKAKVRHNQRFSKALTVKTETRYSSGTLRERLSGLHTREEKGGIQEGLRKEAW
jgi:hypothetical protein